MKLEGGNIPWYSCYLLCMVPIIYPQSSATCRKIITAGDYSYLCRWHRGQTRMSFLHFLAYRKASRWQNPDRLGQSSPLILMIFTTKENQAIQSTAPFTSVHHSTLLIVHVDNDAYVPDWAFANTTGLFINIRFWQSNLTKTLWNIFIL